MRKRSGRQPRFAAVPNETIDDATHLDLAALGLLTVLLRHRDGWDITLAAIGKRYGYGEIAMAAAMGMLQVARYVVKVRIMSAEKNEWSTEVVVYDTPATDEEVAELLAAIEADPGVRQVQLIPPTQTALNRVAKRQEKLAGAGGRKRPPTRGIPGLGDDLRKHGVSAGRSDSLVSRDSGDQGVSKKTVSQKTKNTPPASPGELTPPESQAPPRNEGGGGEIFSAEDKAVLVAEVRALRPEWGATSITKAVDKPGVVERGDPALIRAAMLLVAQDEMSQSPGRLAFDGPWWSKAAASLRSDPAPAYGPRCDDSRHDRYDLNSRYLEDPETGLTRKCPVCHPDFARVAEGVQQ